ncbi:hypothetical protein AA983_04085 [Dermacoccus sp. PE3]|uniref:hypothetical protein n=1 Tax=Dermacoccus sp. PE3 TaxID=1641401 RepID=UPI000641F680|nr:hypothetical protein [Dermacoccus sp. PE3]KLO63904.1 hypothetical protein AA983_04085 [Dermacoccus sp. PE3]
MKAISLRTSLSSCVITAALLLAGCSPSSDSDKTPSSGTATTQERSGATSPPTAPTSSPSKSASPSASEHPLVTKLRNSYAEQGITGEVLEGIDLGGDVNTSDGRFVSYPNGLRVTFKSAASAHAPQTRADGKYGKGTSLMTVRLTISNEGQDTIQLDSFSSLFNAYGGPNLNELEVEAGYTDEDLISDNTAQVISPGSSIDVYSTYEVPAAAPVALWVKTDDYFPELGYTEFIFHGITAPKQ